MFTRRLLLPLGKGTGTRCIKTTPAPHMLQNARNGSVEKKHSPRLERFPPRTETFVAKSSDEWARTVQKNVLLQGSRVRKSAFFDSSLRYGCEGFTVYSKYLMPVAWAGQTAMGEYDNLCENVNLYDASIQRQVEISGPDAFALSQYLTSRNIAKQKIGQCVYGIVTDDDGIVINDPLILKLAEDRYWFSIADRDMALWAKAYASSKNFDVKVEEPDVSSVSIQGPKSVDLLCELYGEEMRDLKFFKFKTVTWHGITTHVARAGWSPERGYEIYFDGNLPVATANEMWDEIVLKGQKHGLMFGSPNQYRRLEGGMLSSCDYENTKLDALELCLPEKMISVEGDFDFIGKEALQKKKAEGLERRVQGVIFEESLPMEAALYHVWAAEGEASDEKGYVTSVGFSPRLNTSIGIATLPIEMSQDGDKIMVSTPAGDFPATVASMPFEGTITEAHKGPLTPTSNFKQSMATSVSMP